jgi:hypothetical protein
MFTTFAAIDGIDTPYPVAYLAPDDWNGYAKPFFTMTTAMHVATAYAARPDEWSTTVTPDGVTVYGIGAGAWRWETVTPCRIERTSLGGGVICAECGSNCECVVCAL